MCDAVARDGGRETPVRTRLSICLKKMRYGTESEAAAVALGAGVPLRAYRCDRCRGFHLTSRTKGKRIPRPARATLDLGHGSGTAGE